MNKYIDAEKLISEIEKKRKILISEYKELAKYEVWKSAKENEIKIYTINDILYIISSLQQEQPEVDLDFQVFAKEMDAVFNLPKEVAENTEENPLNWEYAIARHFYELGLNARKEE